MMKGLDALPDFPSLPSFAQDGLPSYYNHYQEEVFRSMCYRMLEPHIFVVRGVGRSGKTALAFRLLEYASQLGVDIYQWGGKYSVDPYVPFEVNKVKRVEGIPEDDQQKTVIADDILMQGLSARDFSSSEAKQFQKLTSIISHRNISIIMTIQSLRVLDVFGAMSTQKVSLIVKYSTDWNIVLERSGFPFDMVEDMNDYLKYIMDRTGLGTPTGQGDHPSKGWFYDFYERCPGYFYCPDWFGKEVSKVYG